MPVFRRAEVLRVELSEEEVTNILIAAVNADIADGFALDDGTTIDTGSYQHTGITNAPTGGGAWLTYANNVQATSSPADPMEPAPEPPVPAPDPTPEPGEEVEIPPVEDPEEG